MPRDPAVVHRRSVPGACDRTRMDLEWLVHRSDLRPAELCRCGTLRNCCDQSAAWIAESCPLIRPELHCIAILVDKSMMQTAQQRDIQQTGFTAICPVLGMMALQKESICAARIGARLVTLVKRAPQGSCDGAA